MQRFKLKIGRDTVLAIYEIESFLKEQTGKKVTRGEIVTHSWNTIFPLVNSIDWLKIATVNISSIITIDSNDIKGINTTFNLEEDILKSLKDFQFSLAKDFGKLIYFPYALKLILFATILNTNGTLDSYLKQT